MCCRASAACDVGACLVRTYGRGAARLVIHSVTRRWRWLWRRRRPIFPGSTDNGGSRRQYRDRLEGRSPPLTHRFLRQAPAYRCISRSRRVFDINKCRRCRHHRVVCKNRERKIKNKYVRFCKIEYNKNVLRKIHQRIVRDYCEYFNFFFQHFIRLYPNLTRLPILTPLYFRIYTYNTIVHRA